MAVPTDVTDQAQVNALVDRTVERHGRVDILVNNAGIIGVGPIETMTLDDFRAMMATHFWGPLYATMAVLPHMRARQFGRIANVVSVGGKAAVPHLLPYTASKFALTGLTEGLRTELARDNILVTGIYPHTMRTGGHTHAEFKGQREAEYTWFALSDSLPLVSTSAEHVARTLWRAVCDGDAEVVVGWPAGGRRPPEPLPQRDGRGHDARQSAPARARPGRHDPGARRGPEGDGPRLLEPAGPAVHPAELRLIGLLSTLSRGEGARRAGEGSGLRAGNRRGRHWLRASHRLGWVRVAGSSLTTSFPIPARPRRERWPNRACQLY